MLKLHLGRLAHQNGIENLAAGAHSVIGESPADSITPLDRLPRQDKMRDTSLHAQLERRAGARVNLEQLGAHSSTRFRVRIENARRKIDVKPIDMSLKDICVESAQEIASHGEKVDITLSYDDFAVVVPAVAVRQNSLYMYTAFVFDQGKEGKPGCTDIHLDLIFQAAVAEVNKNRYRRIAYFMLSAACSMLFLSWTLY